MKTEQLLSTVEVARRLGVDVSTVYELIFAGDLEGGPTSERVVRIRVTELERFMGDPGGC